MEAQEQVNAPPPPAVPVPVLGPLEDGRMELTPQELEWAWRLKQAIEPRSEVDNLTDFWYAQLALQVQGNTEAGVDRALHLQLFREEYNILDTLEESRKMIPDIMELLPGVALSLSYNHRDGNYVFVYDMGAFDFKKALQTPENARVLLAGCYYICHALCPDLEAIRRGVIIIAECSGFDWSRNMDLAFIRKMWTELLVDYPMDYQKYKYFNAGFFINMINSLKMRFLPHRITSKMETGCRFDGRLSDIYLVPNLKGCSKRVAGRMIDSLIRRHNNQKAYRLPPRPATTTRTAAAAGAALPGED